MFLGRMMIGCFDFNRVGHRQQCEQEEKKISCGLLKIFQSFLKPRGAVRGAERADLHGAGFKR